MLKQTNILSSIMHELSSKLYWTRFKNLTDQYHDNAYAYPTRPTILALSGIVDTTPKSQITQLIGSLPLRQKQGRNSISLARSKANAQVSWFNYNLAPYLGLRHGTVDANTLANNLPLNNCPAGNRTHDLCSDSI